MNKMLLKIGFWLSLFVVIILSILLCYQYYEIKKINRENDRLKHGIKTAHIINKGLTKQVNELLEERKQNAIDREIAKGIINNVKEEKMYLKNTKQQLESETKNND